MEDARREYLQPYLNAKVKVLGMVTKLSHEKGRTRAPIALVDDVVITTLDGKEFTTSHLWMQKAFDLARLVVIAGDRIKCEARVHRYEKMIDGLLETCYALNSPSNVELTSMMPRPEEPMPDDVPAPLPPDPQPTSVPDASLLLKLAREVKAQGGFEAVNDALAKVERLEAVVPGRTELQTYLELFRELRSE